MAPRIASKASSSRASSCASLRTSSPPAGRRSQRSRLCARRACAWPTPCASSTGRRAASTLSRGQLSGLSRSSALLSFEKVPQVRMVERYPTCLLGYSTKVWTRQSPNQEEGFDEAGVHSEGRDEERPVEPRRDQGRRRLHGVGNRDAEERRLGQLHRLR